jgi:predicted nucleotidyltransferase component of viral defense system
MEFHMNLHHNTQLFSQTLRAASQYLKINLGFVEKDYWITLILQRLSDSKFSNDAVFKGGTSLSKGYRLIDDYI